MATAEASAAPEPVPFHLRPNYKWVLVAMLWFMCFFNYADRQAIFSMKPLLTKGIVPPQWWGWIGSSFALVYGLFAPFAGNVGDLFRRKRVILGGLYVWSIICALTALSRKFWHLMFFRAAEGLGETFYFPATTSLLSDYHGKRTRSRALGLHNTGVYAGTVAGGLFGGLISQHYGWRLSFVVFGGLGMLLGLVLAKFVVEPRRGQADRADAGASQPEDPLASGEQATSAKAQVRPASAILAMLVYVACLAVWSPMAIRTGLWAASTFGEGAHVFGLTLGAVPAIAVGIVLAMRITYGQRGAEFLRWVFTTPTVLVLMVVFMGANGVALVALTWMPAFLNEKFGLDLTKAGLWGTLPINGATVLGAALGGLFADLLRRRTPGGRMIVQALALIIGAPFVLMTGLTPTLTMLIVFLTCWGLFKGMYDANIFASVFDVIPPRFRGTAAGFMNMAGWWGGAPAPVLIGWIAQQYTDPKRGLSVAIGSASAIYVASAVIMILGVLAFAKRDAARMEKELAAAPTA